MILSSANALNLDWAKILLFGIELRMKAFDPENHTQRSYNEWEPLISQHGHVFLSD